MGGAASAQVVTIGEIEDVVACSLLLGRAIAAISFPDMYRIYDFHCKDAPPLFSLEDDDDDLPDLIDVSEDQSDAKDKEEVEEKKENPEEDIPPKNYKTEGLLALKVGEDTVYIEDPNRQNEAGWLPLHACCHSQATAAAGVALIEAMAASGGADWNARTARGPGPFNAGWTPLHIAAAYGVRPVAEKLLAAGADPNVENSLTWTPLLECCHRGFTHLARVLVDAGARVDHLPDAEVCARAPFLRAPPQAPLAEAARVGAAEIVRLLLDRGADKDRTNALGWTALHEAAFYNHAEIVQLLLVHGADATRKTAQGALAYQLTVVPAAKQALRDMGGEAAVGPDPTPFSMLAMLAGGGAAPSGGQQGAASSPGGGGGGGAGADEGGGPSEGARGRVALTFSGNRQKVGVRFDQPLRRGNNLGGRCEEDRGFFCDAAHVRLESDCSLADRLEDAALDALLEAALGRPLPAAAALCPFAALLPPPPPLCAAAATAVAVPDEPAAGEGALPRGGAALVAALAGEGGAKWKYKATRDKVKVLSLSSLAFDGKKLRQTSQTAVATLKRGEVVEISQLYVTEGGHTFYKSKDGWMYDLIDEQHSSGIQLEIIEEPHEMKKIKEDDIKTEFQETECQLAEGGDKVSAMEVDAPAPTSAAAAPAAAAAAPAVYRVVGPEGAVVRKGPELDSAPLGLLCPGALAWAASEAGASKQLDHEPVQEGHLIRIARPIEGYVSLRTTGKRALLERADGAEKERARASGDDSAEQAKQKPSAATRASSVDSEDSGTTGAAEGSLLLPGRGFREAGPGDIYRPCIIYISAVDRVLAAQHERYQKFCRKLALLPPGAPVVVVGGLAGAGSGLGGGGGGGGAGGGLPGFLMGKASMGGLLDISFLDSTRGLGGA